MPDRSNEDRARAVLAIDVTRLKADATLVGMLEHGADSIKKARSVEGSTPSIPGVFWTFLGATPRENTERIGVQFDVFGRGFLTASNVADRVRELLHRELPVEIDEVAFFAQWVETTDVGDPEPDVTHLALQFEYEPERKG